MDKVKSPEDPNRCQATPAKGQCHNVKCEGSDYCSIHGGNVAQGALENEKIRNYQLTKWRAKLDRFTDSNHIKSLREEIGLLRMLVESKLENCKDDIDLMLEAGAIADLVMKLEKLVASCNKIEDSMGMMLDKNQILMFASSVITIISSYVTDESILNRIADDIIKSIATED